MTAARFLPLDPASVTTLLCDADGTLFPSEEPAYAASADVTNRFLAGLGAERTYAPEELQRMTNGKNFRGAAAELAAGYQRELNRADLDSWVAEEKDVVTAHLRTALTGVQLSIPVVRGGMALGTWQGIYLFEHRRRPHRREIAAHLIGD